MDKMIGNCVLVVEVVNAGFTAVWAEATCPIIVYEPLLVISGPRKWSLNLQANDTRLELSHDKLNEKEEQISFTFSFKLKDMLFFFLWGMVP